jgi:hypothetical protein
VWIDPQVEPVKLSVGRVQGLEEGRPLVVVYRNVEQRAFMDDLQAFDCTRRFGSTSYANEPRFANVDEWRNYLMRLPGGPPRDLELHARCRRDRVRLAKGQEADLGVFVVRAEEVSWAIEWHSSKAAVIRKDATADLTAFRQASAMFVSDGLHISDA